MYYSINKRLRLIPKSIAHLVKELRAFLVLYTAPQVYSC
nr:MAG TPA: hypothetical protein [Caudoviricetes sp.]